MGDRIISRPNGGVQVARTGRKLFGRRMRAVFLEHLAATCNVRGSAEAAGVTAQCAYALRMRDAGFRADWRVALDQGYARLEAMLLERATSAAPAVIKGDLILPEEPIDRDLALHLLREHKKGLAGVPGTGAAPRPAEWAEVEAYFVKRLKALKGRLDTDDPSSPEVPSSPEASKDGSA